MAIKNILTPFIGLLVSVLLVYLLEVDLVLNTLASDFTNLSLGFILALLDSSLNPSNLSFFIIRWMLVGLISGVLIREIGYGMMSVILTGLLSGTVLVGFIFFEPMSFWFGLTPVEMLQYVFPRWVLGIVGGAAGGVVGLLIGVVSQRRSKRNAFILTEVTPLKISCPNCSTILLSSAKYCGKCGSMLNRDENRESEK